MVMKVQQKDPIKQAISECKPLLLGAFFFGLFINVLMLAVPIYSLQVLDRVLSSGSMDTLVALTLLVLGALIFMGIMQVLRSSVFSHIGRWMDDRLSGDIVTKTIGLAVHDPKIGSQPLRDLAALRAFVTSPHLANLFDAPWAVIYFAVIYIINIYLGLIVTAGAIVLLILAIIAQKMPAKIQDAASEEQLKAFQSMDQIVRNAEVVKSMGLLKNASDKWRSHNSNWLNHTFDAGNIGTVIAQITKTIRLGLQTIVMCFGAYFAISNEITAGAIIAVSILTGRALAPFDAAMPLYQSLVSTKKAFGRLLALSTKQELGAVTTVLPDAKGLITVRKISFEHPGEKRWILKGVGFQLEPGEALGVIGPSGSGKTTLARILVGVLKPSVGQVEIDGAALHQWDPEQLGNIIGYLPQAVELFDGTIAENIARLDENASDEAVIEAAQKAHVHDAILAFPQGYKTNIGPNGSLLSAGQRQRIGLARCFYGDPKFLVMDEPNANLDGDGENAFIQALRRSKELNITTITIAHRPSLLQNVDKLMLLHGGEVKMFGPTESVLAELAAKNQKVRPIHQTEASL